MRNLYPDKTIDERLQLHNLIIKNELAVYVWCVVVKTVSCVFSSEFLVEYVVIANVLNHGSNFLHSYHELMSASFNQFEHLSKSNISLSRTSLYFRTFIYFEYLCILNVTRSLVSVNLF